MKTEGVQQQAISPLETLQIRLEAQLESVLPQEQDAPQSHLWMLARCGQPATRFSSGCDSLVGGLAALPGHLLQSQEA